jgi:hypothetical protein
MTSSHPLASANNAAQLGERYLSGFPAVDQDEFTIKVRDHLIAWLSTTVFHVVPSISQFMLREDLDVLWKNIPFVSARPLWACLKHVTLTTKNFIFYGQLVGSIANERTCPSCSELCELKELSRANRASEGKVEYCWRCQRSSCNTKCSILKDNWWAKCKDAGKRQFDSVFLHLLHVNRRSAHELLQLEEKTSTCHIRDYQILCDDMLTHVAAKIQNQADIDGTCLSGSTTNKVSHGREMGDLDRYKEKP